MPSVRRVRFVQLVQAAQRDSLREWTDFIAEHPSTWFRIYLWQSVTKLAPWSPDRGGFGKRSSGTVAPFPELNAAAVAEVYRVLSRPSPPQSSFANLYAQALTKVYGAVARSEPDGRGIWEVYRTTPSLTAARELSASLRPWRTGWCTEWPWHAHSQLKNGEFHVYRTADADGRLVVPRIAILLRNGKVAEVRGIGPKQAIETSMRQIAMDRARELPGGHRFLRGEGHAKAPPGRPGDGPGAPGVPRPRRGPWTSIRQSSRGRRGGGGYNPPGAIA